MYLARPENEAGCPPPSGTQDTREQHFTLVWQYTGPEHLPARTISSRMNSLKMILRSAYLLATRSLSPKVPRGSINRFMGRWLVGRADSEAGESLRFRRSSLHDG